MLLGTLISSWRKAFSNPSLPFLMVQLPRINDKSALRAGWPEFREVQDRIANTLPKVYSVNTIDLGSVNSDVHPPDKQPVGERLADTALNKIYGRKTPCEGPSFKAAKAQGNKLLIQMGHAAGLTTRDGSLRPILKLPGRTAFTTRRKQKSSPHGTTPSSSSPPRT